MAEMQKGKTHRHPEEEIFQGHGCKQCVHNRDHTCVHQEGLH